MAIVADTKSWTWVLERSCPECGFDASTMDARDAPAQARRQAGVWGRVLQRDDVRVRPSEDRWSPLEYACHVRDVFRIAHGRVALMVGQHDPTFVNWDQDETAAGDDYPSQDPAIVAAELRVAATAFADQLDALPDEAWGRPGTRSDGARFTVESLARYITHDPIHHEYDVG